ncbi:unnamed protein product [Cunninghamella echinulata]
MNSLIPLSPQDNAQSKKRTRVTPTQLIVLEDTFAVSATPDSKMRKHLALKLQMPEQSIQIWFQNRRAKVKMLQRRAVLREEQDAVRAKLYSDSAAALHHHHHHQQPYWFGPPPPPPSSTSAYLPQHHHHQLKVPIQRSWSSDPSLPPPPPPPPFPPSSLSMYTSNSLSDTISLDEKDPFYPGNISLSPTPVTDINPDTLKSLNDSTFLNNTTNTNTTTTATTNTDASTGIINANAITIGTWHRMKINQQDLLCCFQLSERTFEWHIRDSNYHFKMVISFDVLTSLDITISENGMFAQIDMDLNEAPLFYMENRDDATWIQCSDFTEGMQATCHLHHTIRGLASDLRQEIFGIIGMDHHLCQIIRFPMISTPSHHLPLTTTTTTATTDQDAVDFSSLMSWRHQSVPLNMKDFEWSHPSTTF